MVEIKIKEQAIVEDSKGVIGIEKKDIISEETEEREDKIIEEGGEKLKKLFLRKEVLMILGLIILLIFAWHIRTANVPILKDITTGDYTLGPDLDPFLFLRYSKMIVENGSLPEIDTMRSVPLGFNTSGETMLLPYMMAYFHKFLSLFSTVSINYSGVMFPVFMFLLTVIAFFLLVNKIFEDKGKASYLIAFIATAFMIVSPSLLSRTIAGIPEKESAGFLFLFLGLYFFLSAWRASNIKKGIILAVLAGISTASMSAIWGGSIYVFLTIFVFIFLNFIFDKIDKKRYFLYIIWFISSFLGLFLFSARVGFMGLFTSTSFGSNFMLSLLIGINFLIFSTKIKEINFIKKLRNKLPDKVISFAVTVILLFILSILFLGISFIPNFFGHITRQLIQPLTGRHAFTVAENRQPFFSEWKGSFGPIIRNQPLFFWIFALGSVFLFYEAFESLRKKEKYIVVLLYLVFIFSLVFSRYSEGSIMNGASKLSYFFYFGSFVIFIFSFVYLVYSYSKKGLIQKLKEINPSYLFLLSYFVIGIIGARSAIRLLMGLAPPAAILAGYFFAAVSIRALKSKEGIKKIMFWIIAIILIIGTFYSLWFNYQVSLGSAKGFGPSSYTQQWQQAMAWVRENTPKNAVFGHWWDYGYWLQSIGERATMVDGGNVIGYWNYLMGRHVLTAESEEEALEVLYAHNVTHFLIDSTDIGKYSAYSNIGSDENYDRFSWIGTFLLNNQATKETRDEIVYLYQGGISLDEDFTYNSEEGQLFIPARSAGVGGLILKEENKNFKQPEAIFVYQGKQINVPLRYLYYDRLHDFGSGYEGAMYILPTVTEQGGGFDFDKEGAALFLSERNMRALWVRLYLIEEGKNFEIVHIEPSPIIEILKNQGIDVKNFVYFRGVQGPIKIWKINYTGKEKINPEYLQTDWPEEIKQRAFV